ncbi:MAG: DUF4838 domain-containing protein [Armatimonadota bacterium]
MLNIIRPRPIWALLPALLGVGFLLPAAARADFTVAENSRPACVIVRQSGATAAERRAADELASALQQITGATVPIRDSLPGDPKQRVIIVGPGNAASARFPDIDLATFGGEEVVRQTRGTSLLLAGGRPRGTAYAVSRFLQEQGGVRWWTPWASNVPRRSTFRIGEVNIREKPAFEYRETFWFPAFDGDWAARNFSNGHMARLGPEHGGKITYAGDQFVHTFDRLVPVDPHFAQHPEWFSLRGGKRVGGGGAQLCLTNKALRDFVTGRVRQWLKDAPESRIVSLSQNDNVAFCECPDCKALDDREGSHAGSLLAFVNGIAETLEPEFPGIAFDTLAYQYTRRPPMTLRPRPSVIVRLCSIEANFAEPFTHPSNAAFSRDLTDWAKICNRLYVWDYTTNFRHYAQPHPNWFALGPNLRQFQKSNVLGVFSQGAYQSNGAEMAGLLWDPRQNDRALINEFLNGYYGPQSAPFIRQYLTLFADKAKGFNLTCYTGSDAPFFSLASLSEAERLWQKAEAASAAQPERLWRVKQGHLAVQYAVLSSWQRLRLEARRSGTDWPFPESRKALASLWLARAVGPGPLGWSAPTHLSEGGVTPQAFASSLAQDPPPPADPPTRRANPLPPNDIAVTVGGIDGSDALAALYQEGDLSEFRSDAAASDGAAVRMPGSHTEWAFQIPVSRLPKTAQTGRWKVYVTARVEIKPGAADAKNAGAAFHAGIWDKRTATQSAFVAVPAAGTTAGYRSYLIGTVQTSADQYIWVSPTANPAIDSVWIDRVYLVPEMP